MKGVKKSVNYPVTSSVSKQYDVSVIRLILLISLTLSAVLFFFNLGHYSLWDDEAIDALIGKGVLQTGDTSGLIGSNLMGYRNGLLLHNLRVEGEPPFTAFAASASMKLFGQTAWAARLPLTIFGFAAVALLLVWILKLRTTPLIASLYSIGLLCNVSFFLYSRQCHYYGVAIFCFVAIPYIYFNGEGRKPLLLAMGTFSAFLLAANYSFFLILYACLFADYMIWQRKFKPFSLVEIALVVVIPFLTGLVLITWWNPFHTQMGSRLAHDTFFQRLTLFMWHWRDLNRCEMFTGLLLLIAPVTAFVRKDAWLKRALFALVLYIVGMTVISTQSVTETNVSDVRYFAALIPLFIFIEVLTLRALTRKTPWLAIPLAIIAFGTNLFNGGPLLSSGFRSTPTAYLDELLHPLGDPYTITAQWINRNVSDGESIWVLPDYMAYPLMFHAPKAIYAWQLAANNHDPQLIGLPAIHFQGRIPPDYVIAFGPVVQQIKPLIAGWKGVRYEQVATLDFYWKDLYRPELFWRTFTPINRFNKEVEGIYVFKKE